MGTSWLSVAVVVQDGDSILLSVVAMFLCWVVVRVSLLVVVGVSLLVVMVSLLGGDGRLGVLSEKATEWCCVLCCA